MKDRLGRRCEACGLPIYMTMSLEDEFYETVTCINCGDRRDRYEFNDGTDSEGVWPR